MPFVGLLHLDRSTDSITRLDQILQLAAFAANARTQQLLQGVLPGWAHDGEGFQDGVHIDFYATTRGPVDVAQVLVAGVGADVRHFLPSRNP